MILERSPWTLMGIKNVAEPVRNINQLENTSKEAAARLRMQLCRMTR
jgi:hypothetical protein